MAHSGVTLGAFRLFNELASPKNNPKTDWLAEKKQAVASNLLKEAGDYFATEKTLRKEAVTKDMIFKRIDEIELRYKAIYRYHEFDEWMKILLLPQGLQSFCNKMDDHLGVRCDQKPTIEGWRVGTPAYMSQSRESRLPGVSRLIFGPLARSHGNFVL